MRSLRIERPELPPGIVAIPVRTPLVHPGDAEAAGRGARVKAGAVVGDRDAYPSVAFAELDLGVRGRAVLDGVGQRLLDDPVDPGFELG